MSDDVRLGIIHTVLDGMHQIKTHTGEALTHLLCTED